jgi:hypothetical protein
MVDEIAAAGANAIAVVASWRQKTVRSNVITAGAAVTIDDAVVRAAIARAKQLGLSVVVFPILLVDRTAAGQWRGTIQPKDVAAWWLSYERFILHYATIASDEGADALVVGSEMSSTETWRDRWFHLIGRTERVFDGTLIYSANWDHYEHVSFWNRVDAVGVTGYQPLSKRKNASLAELERSWKRTRAKLTAYARSQDKPLWITEVGYTTVDGTATAPWDYSRKGKRDEEEQRRCFEAFASTWTDDDSLAGALVWNWSDPAYTPKDRPAETVVRRWLTSF